MSRRVVYGVGPVGELLASSARQIDCILVSSRREHKEPLAGLIARAHNQRVRVASVESDELSRISGSEGRHQGIVAVVGEFEYADLTDVLGAAREAPGLIVALDGVTDPHNLGAIVRSSLLLGADAVLVPKDRAAGVTGTVTKASAGATEHLPIVQVTNLVRALEEAREADYWRVAVHSGSEAVPLDQLDASMSLVVVLGAEGTGIRPNVAKHCDFHVEIPMCRGQVGSFNVSVAAGVVLYEIARQRGGR